MQFGRNPHSRPASREFRDGYDDWSRTLPPSLTYARFMAEGRGDETFAEWRQRMMAAGVQPDPPKPETPPREPTHHNGFIINKRGPKDPPPVVL